MVVNNLLKFTQLGNGSQDMYPGHDFFNYTMLLIVIFFGGDS